MSKNTKWHVRSNGLNFIVMDHDSNVIAEVKNEQHARLIATTPDKDRLWLKAMAETVIEKARADNAEKQRDAIWSRDGSKLASVVFREVSRQLLSYKDKYFPLGAIVQVDTSGWENVDCSHYKGFGVSVGKCSECPPDKLAVRVESGNVWYYPLECCEIKSGGPVPSWILEMSKEPWWMNALAKQSSEIVGDILSRCEKLKVRESEIQAEINSAKETLRSVCEHCGIEFSGVIHICKD